MDNGELSELAPVSGTLINRSARDDCPRSDPAFPLMPLLHMEREQDDSRSFFFNSLVLLPGKKVAKDLKGLERSSGSSIFTLIRTQMDI